MKPSKTIFIPVLHLMAVLLLSRSPGKQDLAVYFDGLPRYLRGFCRLPGLTPERLVAAIARLTGLRIQKIPNYDEIVRFHQIHLSSMERVTDITQELLPWAEASAWTAALAALIGAKPALAFTAKCLAQELSPPIISMAAACEALWPTKLTVAWDPGWPLTWHHGLRKHLEHLDATFFVWPGWYLSWLDFWARVRVLVKLPALTADFLWRRGLVRKEMPKREVKVITEFIDPRRMQGTAYDADYWIDGQGLKKEDILFFLSRGQSRILQKDGYSRADLVKLFDQKGYQLKLLDDLPYNAGALRSLWSVYCKAAKAGLSRSEAYLGRVLAGAWGGYLEFAPLFHHYRPKHLIYLTFPNGNTGLRWNDAILTGLGRQNGTETIGCQTRSLYARKYEDFFDCFDLYLSWGAAWREKLPGRFDFITEVMDVGCIYLDYLLPTLASKQRSRSHPEKVVVAIFDSDISYNHHYTKEYTVSFLRVCAKLARNYPGCQFLVKNKDPWNAQIIMEDEEFQSLLEKTEGNLEFVSRQRCDYGDIMARADIVIAIAFTTPGVEGLLLGKPALYYSELKCGGQAFSGSADLVAGNFRELDQWFAWALGQVKDGYVPDVRVLDGLSAFRDGRARSRVVEILEG